MTTKSNPSTNVSLEPIAGGFSREGLVAWCSDDCWLAQRGPQANVVVVVQRIND